MCTAKAKEKLIPKYISVSLMAAIDENSFGISHLLLGTLSQKPNIGTAANRNISSFCPKPSVSAVVANAGSNTTLHEAILDLSSQN